jgi:hypothetical protein
MSKRTQINDERNFAGWQEWLDHQYFPGRVFPMTGEFRRGGLAKPAIYALILLGALLLAGSLLLALVALLDSIRRGAGDWPPVVLLSVAGAVISVFGMWMLGWQRAQLRRNARRADVGRDARLRKPDYRLKISYNSPYDKRDRSSDDGAGWG